MALIEDVFKGNLATGLAVGIGAVLFGPTVVQTVGRALRPAAKTIIKGGLVFYRETLSEVGEMASDLVAEARAELEQGAHPSGEAASGGARHREGTEIPRS
jgi:Protein of unknown function (DUF5132)